MTTDKNEVTASEQNNDVTAEEKAQEIVEKVSEQVQDKVQEQVEEQVEEQPKQEVDVAEIIRDTVSKEMNKLRVDQINYTAQQLKEIRLNIAEDLKGYKEHQEALEQQRLSQMDPEEQAEYWKQKAQKPAVPVVEEQPQRDFSQVYSAAQGAAMALGLNNIDVQHDQRLWEGATANMTDQQLVQLASQNIAKLKNPQSQQPAKATQPQKAPPPPSTDGAPKVGNKRFNTISDLASEMASGHINADQYRKGQREIKNQGFTTL
jgi:hypothetical protein